MTHTTVPLPDPTLPPEQQPPLILLAMCVFGEARNQTPKVQQAVAYSVRNRVVAPRNDKGKRFGVGYRGVILRPAAYSCFGDHNLSKMLRPHQWEQPSVWTTCYLSASVVFGGQVADTTEGSTHYYDDSLPTPPYWASAAVIASGRMVPTVRLGSFYFFREP